MSEKPSKEELQGMTTNERLFACGLLDDFGGAVESRDEVEVRRPLNLVHVDGPSIDGIIYRIFR